MVEKAYRSQLTRSRPNRARVPAYASFVMGCLVDLIGIEPMTSSMPWKRAPSCATGPLLGRTVFYSGRLQHIRQCERELGRFSLIVVLKGVASAAPQMPLREPRLQPPQYIS